MKNPSSKSEFGPDPYLNKEEEDQIENWVLELGRKGFPRTSENILDSVQYFLNKNPRNTPFKENRPGKGWLKAFLKRHPKIAPRTCEGITQASACVTESNIRNWFSLILNELREKSLDNILLDPSRVFNADESGFRTCPTSGRVLAQKGRKKCV